MKMPFGKHKGVELDEVPEAYLVWVLDNIDNLAPTLRAMIIERLGLSPKPTSNVPQIDSLKAIYRRMSFKHHPDRGGSTQAMVAINEFWGEIASEFALS